MKKKNKTANLIMVLVIAVMAIGGGLLAYRLRKTDDTGLGSQYRIQSLKDDTLLTEGEDKTCGITIVCDTILDNLDNLEEEKLPYVPKDAVILPRTTVSFADGDTVFEVLQKVCTAADIQLEYSWTPLYDSYYIEGINHIYEFDCGAESGWMYKVNGWFPNYGCSAYQLQGGEEIVWCYTCNGLGADVGETSMDDGSGTGTGETEVDGSSGTDAKETGMNSSNEASVSDTQMDGANGTSVGQTRMDGGK